MSAQLGYKKVAYSMLSYYIFRRENNKDADQTVQFCRLVFASWYCCLHATKPGFLVTRPICV